MFKEHKVEKRVNLVWLQEVEMLIKEVATQVPWDKRADVYAPFLANITGTGWPEVAIMTLDYTRLRCDVIVVGDGMMGSTTYKLDEFAEKYDIIYRATTLQRDKSQAIVVNL